MTQRYQQGFSIVSAIFLIVVLAALGVAMVAFSTVQHQSSALDVQGVRAYQAARAGMDWALYQYRRNGGCANASGTFAPPAASMSDFRVSSSCTANTTFGINTATLQVIACNIPSGGTCPNASPSNPNYVQRILVVQVSQQ